MKHKRRRAERAGRWAENHVALILRLTGHRILAQRWQSPAGEIDLIAETSKTRLYIEVKYRADEDTALDSLTWHQRQRIERAADLHMNRYPPRDDQDVRFDIWVCRPRRWPRRIVDAWRPGLD